MSKPRLLDLCCGAGGAAKGYHDAGFEVVGVDLVAQPNYPFDFILADALTFDPNDLNFDAIHASPPCQFRTAYKRRPNHVKSSPNLIPEIRELLIASGLPYVIENIEGAAAHLRNPIRLCGSSFGLDVRRHRLFESNVPLTAAPCDHEWQTPRFPPATNRTNLRSTVEVGVWRIPLETQQLAMGIDWMTLPELSEAIPPAYTTFLGHQLLDSYEPPYLRPLPPPVQRGHARGRPSRAPGRHLRGPRGASTSRTRLRRSQNAPDLLEHLKPK